MTIVNTNLSFHAIFKRIKITKYISILEKYLMFLKYLG